MKTWLRLLHIAFWMLPVQRWCTVLGLGVLAGLGSLLVSPMPGTDDLITFGYIIALAPLLLFGGAVWRALSAPRMVALAPHGRMRLLLAMLGIAAAIPLSLLVCLALSSLGVPPWYEGVLPWLGLSASITDLRVGGISIFSTATWWLIAWFLASRAPLAMLVVVTVSIGTVYVLGELGVEHPAVLWKQPWGIAPSLAVWAMFGIWYLRTRRVAPPGWLLPGGKSSLAIVTATDTATTGLAQRVALERLLLGGSSMARILVQWAIAGGFLLLVLQLQAGHSDAAARAVAHASFAALILCPVIVAIQSMAIVRRARALWLPCGYSRSQLFSFIERILIRFASAMALVFCIFLLALWFTQPWHPPVTLAQALCAGLLPPLLLAGNVLSCARSWYGYWRWPAVIYLSWSISWGPLLDDLVTYGLIWKDPQGPGWTWIGATLLIGVALRELTRRRWLVLDLPRATA